MATCHSGCEASAYSKFALRLLADSKFAGETEERLEKLLEDGAAPVT